MQLHRHAMFYQTDEMLINSVMYYENAPMSRSVQSDIRMSTRRLGLKLSFYPLKGLMKQITRMLQKSSSLGHKSAIKFIYTLDNVFMNRSIISYNVFR